MVRDVFKCATVLLLFYVCHYQAYFLGRHFTQVNFNGISANKKKAISEQCSTSLVTKLPHLNETCRSDSDCGNRIGYTCCPIGNHRFCVEALRGKTENSDILRHRPFLGVPRYCPTTDPLLEFLPVQNCTKDKECEPRICCPDGQYSYCRTAVFRIESRKTPASRAVINNLISYLQCSPPPPPSLDLFPKTCKYSFDCFPNICCQEKGRKVCRPAKRSILRFFTSLNY